MQFAFRSNMLRSAAICGVLLGLMFSASPASAKIVRWSFDDDAADVRLEGTAKHRSLRDMPRLLRSEGRVLSISGGSGYARVSDTGPDSPLDFDNGDAITIEAWVRPGSVKDGQHMHIVSKGRTTYSAGSKFGRDNLNYALRLTGKKGRAALTFLFRDRNSDANSDERFHRWQSNVTFRPNGDWHHVALSYRFGEPESIRGIVDGQISKGSWDLGGPTSAPPVVDDDELWIGSALGGKASSTFHGEIDEVVLHRGLLPESELKRRYPVAASVPEAPLPEHPSDRVLVEIHENAPTERTWNFRWRTPDRIYEQSDLGFVSLPNKYSAKALRVDRTSAFAVRAMTRATLEDGPLELLIRARNGARLWIDNELVLEAPFHKIFGGGHNPIRDVALLDEPGLRQLQTGDNEVLAEYQGDGQEHDIRLELYLGGENRRPELGETGVFVRQAGGQFRLIGHGPTVPLTDAGWMTFASRQNEAIREIDDDRRREVGGEEQLYWADRHDYARDVWSEKERPAVPELPTGYQANNTIDHFIAAKLNEQELKAREVIDDWAFLRRVALDTIGTIPSEEVIAAYFADPAETRRSRLVNRFLDDPGWADHWVGYWQDVLAENPNILKPTLNNTGPFRYWIYESFRDNKPIDRFATELIRMEGSRFGGGPNGFEMASQNDVPMASKAYVVGQAFLGLEMKCARCHDAPFHDLSQRQLFSVAAMLARKSQKVPASSSVAIAADDPNPPSIELSIFPGDKIAPEWPFESFAVEVDDLERLTTSDDTREQLAAYVTSPHNERFAHVIVNRLWARYLGRGFVEPVHDWEAAAPSHPALLDWLTSELIRSGYDQKHVARLILNSATYQREATSDVPEADYEPFYFDGPVRRRMTAEQVVDSIFAVSGKFLKAGEVNFDADSSQAANVFINLGSPGRAWQFASTSNERDRPSLSLPKAEPFVTLLTAFGWRAARQDPANQRETAPNVVQAGQLATGIIGRRFTRLSDDSEFTRLALQAESAEQLTDEYFQRILTRLPTKKERAVVSRVLVDGFETRVKPDAASGSLDRDYPTTGVSWSNHLRSKANTRQQELAMVIAEGDPPSSRLDPEWRAQAEDVLWSLLNSPEFVIVP
ncbi:DUF1553 domain-containing protein [Stratiformator vulcanicus]|uniref:Planctomycete cytochrome C n=1 Tax=Stratiformator vulcanicus TaxID=2527980 RepID=A0A517R5A6_9PLAN|nr:DUF1553 domain-containing protein [Stratiformator vulcanicus]QDT39071.1 hypothetical protein Pan189_34730 [Stratiformator vulcanicus]